MTGSGSSFKVGMLSPISWRTPPRGYGPWELFVSLLTEGLVERGIDVTLFATKDSITNATLSGVVAQGYSENEHQDAKVGEALHLAALFERAAEFDIIHNSFDFLPLCFSRLVTPPMVTTIHGFSSEKIVPVYQKYDSTSHYVAISAADRHPSLNYAATIHHGIEMDAFEVGTGTRDYLLFFGRIHPDKGTHEAIMAAREAHLPLIIAGIVQDRDYFEQQVLPHIDGNQVKFVGAVSREDKGALLAGARALLHLINFDEPFGYSVVEAMACGTPVVATRRGSMAELIVAGENGLFVEDNGRVPIPEKNQFDPARVRASVEQRYAHTRMIDEYITLYEKIISGEIKP